MLCWHAGSGMLDEFQAWCRAWRALCNMSASLCMAQDCARNYGILATMFTQTWMPCFVAGSQGGAGFPPPPVPGGFAPPPPGGAMPPPPGMPGMPPPGMPPPAAHHQLPGAMAPGVPPPPPGALPPQAMYGGPPGPGGFDTYGAQVRWITIPCRQQCCHTHGLSCSGTAVIATPPACLPSRVRPLEQHL